MSDNFLQSMTFARTDQYLDKCDCDECDNVPPSIREIIQLHKEERRATGSIKRTQQRSLVSRDGQISVWCMNMPQNAEPLIEFGSSHRIVWVKKLTGSTSTSGSAENRSILSWIGNGIVGSSDEEKSRKQIAEWTEGNFFLVPSNGGKENPKIMKNLGSRASGRGNRKVISPKWARILGAIQLIIQ